MISPINYVAHVDFLTDEDGVVSRVMAKDYSNGANVYERKYLNGEFKGLGERIVTLSNNNPLRKLGMQDIGKIVYSHNNVDYFINDKNHREIFSGNLKELRKFIKTIKKLIPKL